MVQDGLVPQLDREASGIITGSEDILKALDSKHSLNARAVVINDVIKDMLKNPAFNADEVNLIGGNHGHLHTFGCIQWECELFNGRPKALCYSLDIQGHHFLNKNPKVHFISI
jgi:hypothetical protein